MSPHAHPQRLRGRGWGRGQAPRVLILSALSVLGLSATTIQYQVTTSGTTGMYQYSISGFTGISACADMPALQCNNEIDIQFDPNVFASVSNGVAPADFDLLLFQPNNPPQAAGDYSAFAPVSNPSLAGPFSVDFTLTGMGMPGAQTFFIEQFDSNGFFEGMTTGTTTLLSGVPEPASLWLTGIALIIAGVVLALRSFRERTA
jgi:hypothetical protein